MEKKLCVSVVLQEQTFTQFIPGRLVGPFDTTLETAEWLARETAQSAAKLAKNMGGRAHDGTKWYIVANELPRS
jgi:hypothetical protein